MAKMIERPHSLKYGVKIGSFKRDPKKPETWNTADALIYIPIVREFPASPNKGNKEFGLFTVDGNFKEPVPDFEVLEITLFLAKTLQKSLELKDWHKEKLDDFVKTFENEAKKRGEVKGTNSDKDKK